MRFSTLLLPNIRADRSRTGSLGREIRLVVLGSLLLWLSAKVQVPFWPVPMTMQSLVVMALPMAFGLRVGCGAVALYLAEGLAGLPVFAGTPMQGAGLAYMMGPTGGFLVGFFAASFVSGAVFEKGNKTKRAAFLAPLAGHAVLFACGVSWLALGLGWEKAAAVGLIPFLWGSFVKSGLLGLVFSLKSRF